MKTTVDLSTGHVETRPLTPEELAALPAAQTEVRDYAAEIEALERQTLLPRPVRDFMLISMEIQAAGQGITPAELRDRNPGYRRVKELDEQIAALRALL